MSSPFAGLTVLVTGTVEGHSRDSANDAVRALGGTPVASVSSKTGLVVVGEGAGVSKMHKARTHGLTVIAAEDFASLAGDPNSWDGQPVGEPIAVFDARHSEPEPDPTPDRHAGIPFADRHLVGKATAYPRIDGTIRREVRMWCQCGHKWLGATIHEPMLCPVEAGAATLNVEDPWGRRDEPAPISDDDAPANPDDLVDFDFDEPVAVGDW